MQTPITFRKRNRYFIPLVVLIFGLGYAASYFVQKNSSAGIQAPIEIKNSTEHISARSAYWSVFTLPYDGVLQIEAKVEIGNPLDINVMKFEQLENFRGKKEFQHFIEFEDHQTKHYRRSGQLAAGKYVFVIRDKSLGIISDSISEVKIDINLEP